MILCGSSSESNAVASSIQVNNIFALTRMDWQHGMIINPDSLDQYQSRFAAARSEDQRTRFKRQMCLACDLAAVMFHELLHVANICRDKPPSDERGAYVAENYFRYYVLRRYCVLGYDCCDWESDPIDNKFQLLVLNEKKRKKGYYAFQRSRCS